MKVKERAVLGFFSRQVRICMWCSQGIVIFSMLKDGQN